MSGLVVSSRVRAFEDLTGRGYGRWLVVASTTERVGGDRRWLCECVCGVQRAVLGSTLRLGRSRSCGCINKDPRQSRCDVLAFERDNPESRYWLGFLIADGSISRNTLSLSLTIGDMPHLLAFRDFLKSDHPIRHRIAMGYAGAPVANEQPTVSLAITSIRVCESIRARGLAERKTTTAIVPSRLALDSDFWRGMVDGDGWLCYNRCRKGGGTGWDINLGLCGTLAICEGFAAFAMNVAGPPPRAKTYSVLPIKSIWRVKLTGYQAIRMADLLYTDARVSLPRKKAMADAFAALASNL